MSAAKHLGRVVDVDRHLVRDRDEVRAQGADRPLRTGEKPTGPNLGPVPEPVRAALAAVVRDMRDVPRAIIGDPAEVVHFLARQARRLDGIRAMRVPAPLPPPAKPPSAVLMAPIGATAARAAAEQTFRAAEVSPSISSAPAGKSPELRSGTSRLVVGRRGRPVPVVLRRARAAGQIEMPL